MAKMTAMRRGRGRFGIAFALAAAGVAIGQGADGAPPVPVPLPFTVCDAAGAFEDGLGDTLAPAATGLDEATAGPVLLQGTVVTMDDTGTVVPGGRVLVRDGAVAAVWAGDEVPAGVDTTGATVVDAGPGGLIFPGLINLHDHPTYAMLPLWPPPATHAQGDAGRPTGTEPYANRYQWNRPGPPEQRRLIGNPQTVLVDREGLGLVAEVVKRAEARAVLGGQTTIEGSVEDPAVTGLLIRNADGTNFGRDQAETTVPSVDNPSFAEAAPALRDRIDRGETTAWLVHLAEGVRDGLRPAGDRTSSRRELDRIRDLGLLTDATVVLHGTGLERADFDAMRRARPGGAPDGLGAKLVWSPLSNLLLYGTTADVYDALAAGVTVSLGTDWTPSGSNTLLGELKVADLALRDPAVLGRSRSKVPALASDVALDRALVEMVTRNPARTMRWPEVGTVAPGTVADLLVVRQPERSPTGGMPASPYRSLIDATEKDVALVLVGGRAVAGDVDVLTSLRGADFDVVESRAGGYRKAVDVTNPLVPRGHQRLADIDRALGDALRALGGDGAEPGDGPVAADATFGYLRQRMACGAHAADDDAVFRDTVLAPMVGTVGGRLNLERIELRPLLTADDDWYFSILAGGFDPTPPFLPYPTNTNVARGGTNPFLPAAFADRWW